jgi:RNA polymerase sigma factor (sigma-70 family)
MIDLEKNIRPKTKKSQEISTQVKNAANIFLNHADLISSAIRSNISDQSQADDIFQDFFLSLVKKPIPKNIKNIPGYINRAVKNDIIDHARRDKRYSNRIQRYARYSSYSNTSKSPQRILIQAEQTQNVLQMINEQLPHHESQAVIQRCCYEDSTEEAAIKLNVNKRSLSRYLCSGLKKIREFANEIQSQNI